MTESSRERLSPCIIRINTSSKLWEERFQDSAPIRCFLYFNLAAFNVRYAKQQGDRNGSSAYFLVSQTTKVHLKTEWRWLRELWSCAWMWPVILMTIANVAFDIFPCKSFVALSLSRWRDILQNALATAVQDTQLQTAIGTSPKAKTDVQSMCGNDDECMSMCTCTLYIHVSVLGMCVCSSCLHVSVLGMCMCTLYGLTDHDS